MKDRGTNNTKTMLVISLGFMIIYLVWQYNWAIYTAFGISIIGVLSNDLSRMIVWLWMKLSWLLSLIVPRIILAIIFYFILTPISFTSKLFRRRSQLVIKNTSDSFFVECEKEFDQASFEKTW